MLIVLSYLGLVRILFKTNSPILIKDAQLTKGDTGVLKVISMLKSKVTSLLNFVESKSKK